ncbi:MAG: DUF4065 domain-containing protein [Desulfovibrio sp.]|nr:DUF4065 domain-containing protein [Desulfovibrio sp.]
MATCFDVAKYFIATADPETGISNLSLQKLCAYAQAVSLALGEGTLFTDEIEAWTHGPVIKRLYDKYKACGRDAIDPEGLDAEHAAALFPPEKRFILEAVRSFYGRFNVWALRDMSHADFPGDFGSQKTIPREAMAQAFADNALVRKIRHFDEKCEELKEKAFIPANPQRIWDALQA